MYVRDQFSIISSYVKYQLKIKPFCSYFSLPLVSEACLGVNCFRKQTSSQRLLYSSRCWRLQQLQSSCCQAGHSSRQSLILLHLRAPASSFLSGVKNEAQDTPRFWYQVQSCGFFKSKRRVWGWGGVWKKQSLPKTHFGDRWAAVIDVEKRAGSHRKFKEEKPEEQISLQCEKAGSKS